MHRRQFIRDTSPNFGLVGTPITPSKNGMLIWNFPFCTLFQQAFTAKQAMINLIKWTRRTALWPMEGDVGAVLRLGNRPKGWKKGRGEKRRWEEFWCLLQCRKQIDATASTYCYYYYYYYYYVVDDVLLTNALTCSLRELCTMVQRRPILGIRQRRQTHHDLAVQQVLALRYILRLIAESYRIIFIIFTKRSVVNECCPRPKLVPISRQTAHKWW